MRIFRGFSLLIALVMLLAGCQAAGISANLEDVQVVAATPVPMEAEPRATAIADEPAPPVDECLSCHSDKDRLIETADPVEEAGEGESKGVG